MHGTVISCGSSPRKTVRFNYCDRAYQFFAFYFFMSIYPYFWLLRTLREMLLNEEINNYNLSLSR